MMHSYHLELQEYLSVSEAGVFSRTVAMYCLPAVTPQESKQELCVLRQGGENMRGGGEIVSVSISHVTSGTMLSSHPARVSVQSIVLRLGSTEIILK